jgi:arylsulfatase A-like enzyme
MAGTVLRTRKVLIQLWVLLLVAAGLGSPWSLWGGDGEDHAEARGLAATLERPNIIVIVADDLDAASLEAMPRLKALLADQGTSFANFFVSLALCCPSRATILRGQYAHNHQVLTNRLPDGGFQRFHALGHELSTVATWLHDAGYHTVLLGKYLNGYPQGVDPAYVPPGWDEWYSPVGGNPYTNFSYRMNESGTLVSYGQREDDYLTDVLARKASDVIWRAADGGWPFFMYVATYSPHAPATPAPRHQDAFPGAAAPRPPSFNEDDLSDKPAWLRNRPPLGPRQIEQIDALYRRRLQSLQAVDELVERLVGALEATGQLSRTYLFFTSDNGFHLGQHRLPQGKNTAYEEDIHVPLLVRGPGVPAGRVIEHLAVNTDLAPTFADLAGVIAPAFVDGRSLVPLLRSDAPAPAQWRQAVLIEHFAGRATRRQAQEQRRRELPRERRARPRRRLVRGGGAPAFAAIRTPQYLYVEYAIGERELYDLHADPYELSNLASAVSPALLSSLAGRLHALQHCTGAGCRAAEDAPVTAATLPALARADGQP